MSDDIFYSHRINQDLSTNGKPSHLAYNIGDEYSDEAVNDNELRFVRSDGAADQYRAI